jgi:resuscitation-promoting factor RpfB
MGPRRKAALLVGGGLTALLLVCCGGAALVNAVGGNSQKKAASAQGADQKGQNGAADKAPQAAATTSSAPAQPQVVTKTITETQPIPFAAKTVNDSTQAKGSREVRTPGADGVKTLTYEVTYTDGVETGRKLVSEVVTTQPVDQVTAVGTKVEQQPKCDPNYAGACVPIASDVDCEGGGGNGPAYVRGPVTVVGIDIYKLDTDHDGVACEN